MSRQTRGRHWLQAASAGTLALRNRLLQPGVVRWHYRVAPRQQCIRRQRKDGRRWRNCRSGWEIAAGQRVAVSNAMSGARQFSVVGLPLLVGGVGVSNAVKSHLDRAATPSQR
jgi:predicted lysophospholipase L1 biosynthesis ABC-type transport system permease subunit